MTKTRKPQTKQTTKATPNTPISCVQQAEDMYRRLIDAVNARIDNGEVNTTLLREAASVIRAAASIDGERRKALAATRKQFDHYSRAGVLSWARAQLGHEERRTLMRELAAIDSTESILA